MKMEDSNKKTWEILKEIKGRFDFEKTFFIIWKRPDENGNFNFEKDEEESLAKLVNSQTIEKRSEPVYIEKMRKIAGLVDAYHYDFSKEYGNGKFNLCINKGKNFYKIYQEYKEHYEPDTLAKIIIINLRKGIYCKKTPKLIYEISGKRKEIIKRLLGGTASMSDLISIIGKNDSEISKSIREINKNFIKYCKIKKDLIINSRTAGGYDLNKDELIIKSLT